MEYDPESPTSFSLSNGFQKSPGRKLLLPPSARERLCAKFLGTPLDLFRRKGPFLLFFFSSTLRRILSPSFLVINASGTRDGDDFPLLWLDTFFYPF